MRRQSNTQTSVPRIAVIWIDWYAYHVARMRGLLSVPDLAGRAVGIELVGGVGVHPGLKFREDHVAELPVHTLMPDSSWKDAGQLKLSLLLWRKLSALDSEAVLVPGYATLPAVAAAVWAKLHGRRSILMTESTGFDHVRFAWKEWIKSLLIQTLFDSAIAGGSAHIRYLHKLRFPSSRIARFYDVVDNQGIDHSTSELRYAATRTDELPPSPYFLYVGRLAHEKNVSGLISAWVAYRKCGGDWPLVLVGDGPCAIRLKQQTAESGFANDIYFAGLRSSSELAPFYAFAGSFVLPSNREPWGLVVNEAMASGLPVLVSIRCGSAEDLVQAGKNGFTFDPGSQREILAAMTTISTMSVSDRKEMGEASRRLIAPYSPQNFGRSVASLLKGVTAI